MNEAIVKVERSGDVLLSAENIGFSVSGKTILADVDLQLRSKEIITLIGPNGAGKTSLIRILLGLNKATSGTVKRKNNLRIGYVPQRISVPEVMPLRVYDFLNVTGRYQMEQCLQILTEVNCDYLLYSPMQNISGGEMQRVLLARALLKEPQLLVLDEPASGMDIIGQQALYETIRHVRDKHGCGVLMVSHDLHLVMAATDKVVVLVTLMMSASTRNTLSCLVMQSMVLHCIHIIMITSMICREISSCLNIVTPVSTIRKRNDGCF
jgi:zinc transport system ATP-binding protein